MILCLGKPMREDVEKPENPQSEIKKAFLIFISKNILLYNVAFIFCGRTSF